MYSMILMVALTGSTDTIDAHHRGGGCYGGGYAGCYGGGYGYGGGCYGSTFGAGCSGWLASCYGGGGYGGCYGGGYGCYGGGYACSGGGHHRRGGLFGGGRHGHRGGGCYGGGYGGGYGCYGGGYGCYGGGYVSYGCNGGMGYGGCYGGMGFGGMSVGCYGGAPVMGGPPVGGTPAGGTTDEKKDMPKGGEPIGEPKDKDKEDKVSIAAPGTIVVSLPADARLTVDGVPTSSTSTVRAFATPVLQPGHAYSYTLRAEVTRNGQTVRMERQVPVAAGQTSRVIMDIPASTQRVASR